MMTKTIEKHSRDAQVAGRRAPGHGVLAMASSAATVPLFPLQPLSAEFRVRAGETLHRRTSRTLAAALAAPMYQSLRLTRRADQRMAAQFRLLRGEGGAR
jgi:hypothetical protein